MVDGVVMVVIIHDRHEVRGRDALQARPRWRRAGRIQRLVSRRQRRRSLLMMVGGAARGRARVPVGEARGPSTITGNLAVVGGRAGRPQRVGHPLPSGDVITVSSMANPPLIVSLLHS